MRIANENLQTTATSMGTSFNMRALYLGHIVNYSVQLTFTGTPTGSFKLQCSDDPGMPDGGQTPQALNVTNWTDVAGSSQSITTAGNIAYNVQNAGYNWVRVVYTASSSTGSLTVARANIKGV